LEAWEWVHREKRRRRRRGRRRRRRMGVLPMLPL
jgi:hypothetical protein